jgi:hypothetical protein
MTLPRDEILRRNPHIDRKRAAAYEAFWEAKVRNGADIRATYRVAPPLGSLPVRSSQKGTGTFQSERVVAPR